MLRPVLLLAALAAVCCLALPLSPQPEGNHESRQFVHTRLISSERVDAVTAFKLVEQEAEADFAARIKQGGVVATLAQYGESLHRMALVEARKRIEELKALDRPIPILELSRFVLTARDGTELFTRLYVPADVSLKYSTAMARSPYGPTTSLLAFIFVLDGHAGVSQDIRGTGQSTGFFDVWRQDGKDGYDTMSWISSQSWSNGQVYSLGGSADGCSAFTQWIESPPWLKAQWLIWYASNSHPSVYPGGAYRSNLIDNWMGSTCPDCIPDIKANEAFTDYWTPITSSGKFNMVTGATINWGGWYDIFAETTIDGFNGAQNEGARDVQGNNFLVMDVGGHCFGTYHRGGHSALPIRLPLNLFHHVRDNVSYADAAYLIKSKLGVQAISFFVMGPDTRLSAGNYWTSVPNWPRVSEISYYLQTGNSLSSSVPLNGGSMTYTYDPANPVPTIGGNELFGGCGPKDQVGLESRSDVLVFTSATLISNTPVTGLVRAILYVSSDAVDTDFTVKLTDVHPDGRSLLIVDNVIRMRWKDSNITPTLLAPGRVYQVEIKLGYTSYIFNRGHRIRVAVSSSNAPRFSANPNTGLPISDASGRTVVAQNTVHFSRTYPSRLILPGVDIADIPENISLRDLSF